MEFPDVEPVLAAYPIEFLGPPTDKNGDTLMFYTFGGTYPTRRCAEIILGHHYTDHRYFNIRPGADGGDVYVVLWQEGDAGRFHGDVYWVADTLCCCLKVNPWLLWDQTIPNVIPTVRVIN